MAQFVHDLFSEYYSKCSAMICVPPLPERREYGAMLHDQKIMVRHKAFGDASSLIEFLSDFVPSDVYYSVAYYEKPGDQEMSEKGWRGADLVFDIDADHIPAACEKVHDEWICEACGFAGNGNLPSVCPSCANEKFRVKVWPCDKCVESAKKETVKLLDMLMDDLGLSEKDIQVFFSGHRGYHIHVEDSLIRELDSVARKEIVDYVIGLGLDTGFLDVLQKGIENSNNSGDLGLSSYGWKRRVARGVKRIITNAQLEDYKTFGIGANAAQILLEKKDKIIKSWETSGFSSHIKGLRPQTLKRLFEASIPLQSSKIDTVVTTDTHRLIRLAGSLHGKTGLRKAEVAISDIDSFDPFKSAVAFEKGETTVFVESAPEFRIGEGTFGPFDDQKVTLPTAAALLLVCKKRAKVVE